MDKIFLLNGRQVIGKFITPYPAILDFVGTNLLSLKAFNGEYESHAYYDVARSRDESYDCEIGDEIDIKQAELFIKLRIDMGPEPEEEKDLMI